MSPLRLNYIDLTNLTNALPSKDLGILAPTADTYPGA